MELTAEDILSRCTNARRRRWETDRMCEMLEDYYNGGHIPTDGCKTIDSLGLGNRQLRRAHNLLRSTVEYEPGAIEVVAGGLDDFERTTDTELAFEEATASWFRDHYRTIASQVAGDFLISGRAFAWRYSDRDIKFRVGRPLHEAGASTDIGDDSFWWWAFPWQLNMRDIDHLMKTARGENNKGGWQKDGLRALKRYILSRNIRGEEVNVSEDDIDAPFSDSIGGNPLNCYIYFEKCKDKKGVHRTVDVKIISRHSEKSAIEKTHTLDEQTRKRVIDVTLKLNVKDAENEKIIFSKKNAFESVFSCLIPWIGDARISGKQHMDVVEGDGKQFIPRLMAMEEMMSSAVTGTTFAMQPNFAANRDVNKNVLKRIQETGIPSYGVAPNGVGLLDKSNVITSSRAGLELVQALGLSIEEESSTNNLPQAMGKRTNTEFAAEAQQLVDSTQESVTLRFTFWHAGWDALCQAIGDTILKTGGWAKADPSYWDVKDIHKRFVDKGGRMADLKKGMFVFRSRRMLGGADRSSALQKLNLVINNPNAPADMIQWAFREATKLMFGPETAKYFEEPRQQTDRSQLETAMLQTNAALTTLLPIPAEQGDDPIAHLQQVHVPALMQQIQLAANKGSRTPEDTARVQALLMHIEADVANLPGQAREQATLQLQQAVQQYAQIPEQAPIDEQQMKIADMQIKQAKLQNELENGANLRQMRQFGAQQKAEKDNFSMMAQAKSLGQQDRRIAVEEQKAQEEAASKLLQTK